MENKLIFFTGGTSGLGKIAVCELANIGAQVIVTVRNSSKGESLQGYFRKKYPLAKGNIELVDLTSPPLCQ